MVQWLRVCTSNVGNEVSVPDQVIKITYAMWCSQKLKIKKKSICSLFRKKIIAFDNCKFAKDWILIPVATTNIHCQIKDYLLINIIIGLQKVRHDRSD